MTGSAAAPTPLLAAAVQYARRTLDALTAERLAAATPCRGWDLRTLLRHLDDSLAALHDGIAAGAVALQPSPDDPGSRADDPAQRLVASIRRRGDRLLGACRVARGSSGSVVIGHLRMPLATVVLVGAVELTAHGWDVARSLGRDEPVPDPLARDLLRALPAVVNDATRAGLFAPPVAVPARSRPGERLVAQLGRSPWWGAGPAG